MDHIILREEDQGPCRVSLKNFDTKNAEEERGREIKELCAVR